MRQIVFILIFFIILTNCYGFTEICKALDNPSNTISENCLKQLKTICNNTALLWKLYDASSKYPISGMSYSSNMDFGNFDECISVEYEDMNGRILGKHCPAGMVVINPLIPTDQKFKQYNQQKIVNFNNSLIKDYKYVKNMDAGVLMTVLSICVPDQCTVNELGASYIISNLDNFIVLYMDIISCQTSETYKDYSASDIVFITVLVIILILIVASTSYDVFLHYTERESKHPLFLAFSYLTNGRNLLHISKNNTGQITCLNGLRFISMMWVMVYHASELYTNSPVLNKVDSVNWGKKWYSQYGQAGSIAVDTFFFMTGLLLISGHIRKNRETDCLTQICGIPSIILHRYLRLTPALAMAYFTTITILDKLGTGPIYPLITDYLAGSCRKYWWSFFLYIQNYVNYDKICLFHTWYLSVDMQMFILAPLILIPVALFYQKHLKQVFISLGILEVFFIILPIILNLEDVGKENTYSTHSKVVDFVLGMQTGLILLTTKDKRYPFTKLQNLIIWFIALIILLTIVIYENDVIVHPNDTKTILFSGLYKPLWCFSLTWIVYSCHSGYGGFINWILSRPIFQIGARLSYCMYILHGLVELYFEGIMRTCIYFSDYAMLYVWCGHFIVTMILAFIWTLSFELPILKIDNFLLSSSRQPVKKQQL